LYFLSTPNVSTYSFIVWIHSASSHLLGYAGQLRYPHQQLLNFMLSRL
jgi:hypothetical protein